MPTTAPLPPALSVGCPICAAEPGSPCQDAVAGWIQPVERPHLYRTQIAVEVTR